jgi:hopene-associated glycosyltransferase HpnB
MPSILLLITACSALIWLIILLLPWMPWRNTEVLVIKETEEYPDLSDVTVVIPARNETEVIRATLDALTRQGKGLRVILVDDRSEDDTAEVAKGVKDLDLTILRGAELPQGWSGKIWALRQGVAQVSTRLTLLLDADIELGENVIYSLKGKMIEDERQFVSIMASLRMHTGWEKLLMPAFIYFFKMLYPFRLTNSKYKSFASAAGGCVLLETKLFREIGGLEMIKGAVIDDCALAKEVKKAGFRIWIGQSQVVRSMRAYKSLGVIWNMIARSAYSQLNYSLSLLILVTIVLLIMFWAPLMGVLIPAARIRLLGISALLMMTITYLPTIRYYRLGLGWSLLLPLAGTLYLGMTWSSALRYWRGEKTRWKGRVRER